MPPWPGIESAKSFILKALLKPEAKNPPNGATREANAANTRACNCTGRYDKVVNWEDGNIRLIRVSAVAPISMVLGTNTQFEEQVT